MKLSTISNGCLAIWSPVRSCRNPRPLPLFYSFAKRYIPSPSLRYHFHSASASRDVASPLTSVFPSSPAAHCGEVAEGLNGAELQYALMRLQARFLRLGRTKDDDELSDEIQGIFHRAADPYDAFIFIAENTTADLCNVVFKEFAEWIKPFDLTLTHLLTAEVKVRLFRESLRQDASTRKQMFDVFQLREGDTRVFESDVRTLVHEGKHLLALHCILAFNLQEQFDLPKEVLIPCILNQRLEPIMAYIRDKPKLQQDVVSALHRLCLAPADEVDSYFRDHKIAMKNKSSAKIACDYDSRVYLMNKAGSRFAKACKLSWNHVIGQTKINNAIAELVSLRLQADSLEDFRDFVHIVLAERDGIPPAQSSLEFFVKELAAVDAKEAQFWVEHFKLDADVLEVATADRTTLNVEPLSQHGEDESCLELPQLQKNTILVDRGPGLDSLRVALQDFSCGEDDHFLLGIDTEWPPSFGLSIRNNASILQCALPNGKVYVVDLVTLERSVDHHDLTELIGQIFSDQKFRKLGFSFAADIFALSTALPFCSSVLQRSLNTVCLQMLYDNLLRMDEQFGLNVATGSALVCKPRHSVGLSQLTRHFLGKPIKPHRQHITNWRRRPLQQTQLHYAAADAYCLPMLYKAMRVRALQLKLDFDDAAKRSPAVTSFQKT